MDKQKDCIESIKKAPDWVKAAVGLVTLIIGFIALFQENPYLSITVSVAVAFVAAFCLCLYVAFAKTPPLIKGGKGVYRFENYRSWALVGVFLVPIVFVLLLAGESSRSFVTIAFVGTVTPTPSPTVTPTPFPMVDQNAQLTTFPELQATVVALSSHLRRLEVQLTGITQEPATVYSATVEALMNQQAILQAERESLLATIEAMQTPIATSGRKLPVEIYPETSRSNSPEWRNRVVLSDLSEIIKFKLNVKNLTDTPSTSTLVKVELPAGLAFLPGSIEVRVDPHVPSLAGSVITYDVTDESSLFESGLDIGVLAPWKKRGHYDEVIFQTQLNYCPILDYLILGASAKIDESDWVVSQATVDIADLACQPPLVVKEVSNTEHPGWFDSVEASIGDVVEFHLVISNPNSVKMDEIRVKELVPDGLELYPGRVRLIFCGQTTMGPNPKNGNLFDSAGYLLGSLEGTEDSWEISYLATVTSCPDSGYSISVPGLVTSLQTEGVMNAATVNVRNCKD